MKLTHTTMALIVAVLALPTAADEENEAAATEVARDEEAIENTVVATRKSTADLRHELWRSEDDFYSLYNKLNDDNLYDVRCTYEAPTGSRIKHHVCRTEFLVRAIRRGEIDRRSNLKTNPRIANQMAKFREKLDTLIRANPELQAAAGKLNSARAQYMAQDEKNARN